MRRTVPVSESHENKLLILHHKTPELCQNPLLHPISIRKYTHTQTHTDTHIDTCTDHKGERSGAIALNSS